MRTSSATRWWPRPRSCPVGDDGSICVANSERTNVVVDVTGSFPAGSGFVPVTPVRLADTREPAGAVRQRAGTPLVVDVGSVRRCPGRRPSGRAVGHRDRCRCGRLRERRAVRPATRHDLERERRRRGDGAEPRDHPTRRQWARVRRVERGHAPPRRPERLVHLVGRHGRRRRHTGARHPHPGERPSRRREHGGGAGRGNRRGAGGRVGRGAEPDVGRPGWQRVPHGVPVRDRPADGVEPQRPARA